MSKAINFPNLGIYLENVGKSFRVFGLEIAYYGVIIAAALVSGIFMALWAAEKTGQDKDAYFDMGIVGILISLVSARLYYVIFAWDQYKDDLLSIFNTREGGLAIYGGVIGGVLCMWYFSRKKKIPFGLMADTVSVGLVLGQIIGRWGNFFNREAFGGYTDSLLAMQLPLDAVMRSDVTEEMLEHAVTIDGTTFIQVHPTFLYESLWNVGVLILLLLILRHRRFNGQVFTWYLLGYGLGRLWIEGLRTDQLLMPVTGWPVSQVLSGVLSVAACLIIIRNRKNNELLKGRGAKHEKIGESEGRN